MRNLLREWILNMKINTLGISFVVCVYIFTLLNLIKKPVTYNKIKRQMKLNKLEKSVGVNRPYS